MGILEISNLKEFLLDQWKWGYVNKKLEEVIPLVNELQTVPLLVIASMMKLSLVGSSPSMGVA